MACYAFKGGPYHDLLVRFGYDPRLSVEGRQYVFSRSPLSLLCWARFTYSTFPFRFNRRRYQRLFFRDKDQQKAVGRKRRGFGDDSAIASARKLAAANWSLQDNERNALSNFFYILEQI